MTEPTEWFEILPADATHLDLAERLDIFGQPPVNDPLAVALMAAHLFREVRHGCG